MAEGAAVDFRGLEKRVKQMEREFSDLKGELLGDDGLLRQIRAEVKDCYSSLGRVEAMLLKIRKAVQ